MSVGKDLTWLLYMEACVALKPQYTPNTQRRDASRIRVRTRAWASSYWLNSFSLVTRLTSWCVNLGVYYVMCNHSTHKLYNFQVLWIKQLFHRNCAPGLYTAYVSPNRLVFCNSSFAQYRGADKCLARPTCLCILCDG